MTGSSVRLDAARARRRLASAGEALTLPYDAAPDDGRGGDRGSPGSEPGSARGSQRTRGDAASQDGGDAASQDGGDAASQGGGEVASQGAGELGALLERARDVADGLRAIAPERIHPEGLRDALTRLRKVRNRLEAVETAWLTQVRNRKVHRDDGASSASKWAAEQLGGSQRDAVDQLRTADRLVDLPDTAGAFADGDITREAASAIGRAMQDDRLGDTDDAEGRLVAAAKGGGADQVRRTAREMRATADVERGEADAARKRARRYANLWLRGDGMVKIEALLDQDNGEPFYTAYQALFNASLKDQTTQPGETSGEGRTVRQRGADVLGEMARRLLAGGDIPDTAGRAATVLVTIPEATLRGRLDDGPARLRFTGQVPVSTARRMACDAGIVPVVVNGRSVPVDIGRASRHPTAAQRRCLVVRDAGCCRRCGRNDRLLIAHHCTYWADGGPTDLHNLILVCWECHQLLHEGRWHATWNPDNSVTFTHPDGRRIIRPPPT